MKSALKWLGNSEQLIFATNQLLDDLSINTKLAPKNEEKIKESMMYLRKLEIENFARSFLQGVKFTNSKLERFLSLVHKIIDTFDDICVDVFENVSQYLLPFLYSIKICLEELSKGEVLKVISTFLSSLTYSIKELDNLFKMVESKEFNLTTLFKQLNKTFQGSEQVTNFEPFQQFQILAQQQEWIHSFELLLESFKVHPDKIHFFRTVLINTLELVSEEKAITRIQQFLKPMLPKQQTIDLAFKNLIDCLNPVNHLLLWNFFLGRELSSNKIDRNLHFMQIIDHQLNEQTKEKNEKSNENSKEKENEKEKEKEKEKECKKEKEEIDKKNLQNYNITRAITQYRKLNLEKANELLNIEINSNSNNYLIWAWKSIFTVAANGKRGVEESLGYWEKAIKIIGDEEKIPNEIVLALSESLMDTLQLERAKVLLLKRVPADLTQNKKRKQTIKNTKTETTKPLPLLIISRLALIHILQGENSKASELIIHSMSISDFTFHENRSNYFLLSSILSLSKEWYNRALWETINFLNENIASQSQQANELALFISAISRNKLDLFELAKKDWETIIKLKGETPFLLDWFKNNFEN